MARLSTDVAVIGAGPAGCVFATRMAQLGYEVCVIERARFPRTRLGESLSPGVMPMLASIGAAAVVEAVGFPRVDAVSTNWDGTEAVRQDPRAEGMLVDRGRFDAALLARAVEMGVQVLQPAQVRHHARTPEGWRIQVDGPGDALEIDAAFLADASGRSARRGRRRTVMGPRTIAIYGYWTGARLPRRPRIEAGQREWYWGVPIPDGSYNTLIFVDGDRFRAEPGGSLDDRLRALLARSSLMSDTRDPRLRAPARAADATPYLDEECVGERQIRLGDAALAIDPLSSSGVQKAIQTALSGAIVANTLLRRPDAGDAAHQYYRNSLRESAERHRAWAAGHYAAAGVRFRDPFWTARSAAEGSDSGPASERRESAIADDVPLRLSPDARLEEIPCLGAQYVEMRSALRHPRLDGPLAYLGGRELAPLLSEVRRGITSQELAWRWSRSVPLGIGLSIARWLLGRGVLLPVQGGDGLSESMSRGTVANHGARTAPDPRPRR